MKGKERRNLANILFILSIIGIFFLYKIIGEEAFKRLQKHKRRRSQRLRERKRETDHIASASVSSKQKKPKEVELRQRQVKKGWFSSLLEASREGEKKDKARRQKDFRRFLKILLGLYFGVGLILWFIIPIFNIGGFTCDNGEHVPHFWLNDGTDDCGDNSDENGNFIEEGFNGSGFFAVVCVVLSMVITVITPAKRTIQPPKEKKISSKSKKNPLTQSQFVTLSSLIIIFLIIITGSKFFNDLDLIPFTCDNGEEITIAELTDGHYDCVDGSDEALNNNRALEYTGYDDGEGFVTIFALLFLIIFPISLYIIGKVWERSEKQSKIVLLIIIILFGIHYMGSNFGKNQSWECDNGEEISHTYYYNDGYVHCTDGSDELPTHDREDTESGPSPVFDWLLYWCALPFIIFAIPFFLKKDKAEP